MAIKHLINTRNPGELRLFQSRMIRLGNIRTGVFETPPGKRGRPAKLDRFRFTSPDRDLIQAVADEYGGEVAEYRPQGQGRPGWMVDTGADRIPVYVINGQKIDPTYEAWAGGGRCLRRCDGEWDAARQVPCVCNGLNQEEEPPAPRDLCKPTTRVNLMLPAIEGIGSWLYESHGENFAMETGGVFAQLIASAPVPVPAWFCLEAETRQHRKPDGGFEKRDFYVARFRITAITPEQIALGGDVVSRILTQAGAPAALAAPVSAVPAIAAAPAEFRPPRGPAFDGRDLDGPAAPAVVRHDPARGGYTGPAVEPSAELVAKILRDIEAQDTLDGLEAIKAKLKTRGINPPQSVKDAWASKAKAVALAQLNEMAEADLGGFADAVDALPPDDREELHRRLAEAEVRQADPDYDPAPGPCTDPWCASGPAPCGFTPDQHMEAHGAAAIIEADRAAGRIPEYAVGDAVTVAGVEFTKISDNPFPPGTPAAQAEAEGEAVEGVVEGLPEVPDGDYEIPREMAQIMTLAGQRTPPWTLAQVTAAIVAAHELPHVGAVTGRQLAQFRLAMERGLFND